MTEDLQLKLAIACCWSWHLSSPVVAAERYSFAKVYIENLSL